MVELEANRDFYAGKPAIDRVVIKFGGATPVIELTSGNVDAVVYLDHSDVPKLKADPRFRVYHSWVLTEPQALLWNHRHPLFSDPLVRRALTQAIDRRELLRVLDFPEKTPLVDGLSPWDRADRLYREGKLDEGYSYDPKAAKRLLERAGWVDLDGDGVRERSGVKAHFTLLARHGGQLSTMMPAVFIQDQLRRVGVSMEIQALDPSLVRAAYRSGDFDSMIHDVPNVPQRLLQWDWFGDGSPIAYRNEQLVRLLEAVLVEMDPDAQDLIYGKINEILRLDMPVTFLFPWVETFAAHRRIRGLSTPHPANPLGYMDELWLEEDD